MKKGLKKERKRKREMKERQWKTVQPGPAQTQTVPRGSLLLLLADLRFLSSILSCNHEFILLKIT